MRVQTFRVATLPRQPDGNRFGIVTHGCRVVPYVEKLCIGLKNEKYTYELRSYETSIPLKFVVTLPIFFPERKFFAYVCLQNNNAYGSIKIIIDA